MTTQKCQNLILLTVILTTFNLFESVFSPFYAESFGASQCFAADPVKRPALNPQDWKFIENDEIKLGVRLDMGAGIGWFSLKSDDINFVNHFDHGRLLQQSFYGAADGSKWGRQPWRWNPVQGGGYRGEAAKIESITAEANRLQAITLPKHWATGADLPEVRYEEDILLDGPVAKIRFKMTYSGTVSHPAHHQEIPALFVDQTYRTLVCYDGDQPWTGADLRRVEPGFPNEYVNFTEQWASWINAENHGIGMYVPQAELLTCYRFGKPGETSSCSYFAPLVTLAVTPGTVFEYDVYLTAGRLDEIRSRFTKIHENLVQETRSTTHLGDPEAVK